MKVYILSCIYLEDSSCNVFDHHYESKIRGVFTSKEAAKKFINVIMPYPGVTLRMIESNDDDFEEYEEYTVYNDGVFANIYYRIEEMGVMGDD